MRTSSRTVALVLFDEVELLDVAAPLGALTLAGRQWNWRPFTVRAVASTPGTIATRSQLGFADVGTLDSCESAELVVVPGGYGARRALDDAALVDALRRLASGDAPLFGVGMGTLLLAKAGLVGDAEVAVSAEVAPLLTEIEPRARPATDRAELGSGRLHSARGGGAALLRTLELLAELLGEKQARGVAEVLGVPFREAARMRIEILGG